MVLIIVMNQHRTSLNRKFCFFICFSFTSRDQNIRNVVTLWLCDRLDFCFLNLFQKTAREIAHWNDRNQFINLNAAYFLELSHPEIMMVCVCVLWGLTLFFATFFFCVVQLINLDRFRNCNRYISRGALIHMTHCHAELSVNQFISWS